MIMMAAGDIVSFDFSSRDHYHRIADAFGDPEIQLPMTFAIDGYTVDCVVSSVEEYQRVRLLVVKVNRVQ